MVLIIATLFNYTTSSVAMVSALLVHTPGPGPPVHTSVDIKNFRAERGLDTLATSSGAQC